MIDLFRQIGNSVALISPEKDYRMLDAWGNVKKYIPDAGQDVTTAQTWTHTQTGTNTWINSLTAGEDFTITTGATDFNGYSSQLLGESFKIASGMPFSVTAKIKMSVATQSDLLFGLAETDTTLTAASSAHAIAVTGAGLFFSKIDAVTAITANVYDSGAAVDTATLDAVMDVAYHTYDIYSDDGSTVVFVFDGSEVARFATGLPTAAMTLSLSVRNGASAAVTLSMKETKAVQVFS